MIATSFGRLDLRRPVRQGTTLNRGRVAWWLAVPNRVGGRVYHDLMGAGRYNAVLAGYTGGAAWSPSTRPGGFAHFAFEPTGTANVPRALALGAVNFSLAAWVYLATASEHGVFLYTGNSANDGFEFGVGGFNFFTNNNFFIVGFEPIANVNPFVAIGTGWHRCAISTDPTNVRFYIDGVLRATAATPAGVLAPTVSTSLGSEIGTIGREFTGPLDDLTAWNRVLSPADFALDYQQSSLGYPHDLRRLRPLRYAPAHSSVTLSATAGPASASLGLFAQPRPSMATLAAQADPATITWTIDSGSTGPLTIGEYYSIAAPAPEADPWGVDPDETSLLN